MLANGKTQQQVADHFGVHRNTIWRSRQRVQRTVTEEAAIKKERQHKPCGTPAAYQRHLHNGETACQPCCDAEAKYRKDLYNSPKHVAMRAAKREADRQANEQQEAEAA